MDILLGTLTTPDLTVYRFASESYQSKSSDTIANVEFEANISNNISFEKEIGVYEFGTKSQTRIGNLKLFNHHGLYDDLIDDPRDSVLVYEIVKRGASYDTAVKVGEWIVDSANSEGENIANVVLVDKLAKVDRNTEHEYFPNTIQYTANHDQPEPIAIGYVTQVPLVKTDDNNNIFEVHYEGAVTNVLKVTDTANPFDPNATPTPDYVEKVIVETGGYGIDLSNAAVGVITADVEGGDL